MNLDQMIAAAQKPGFKAEQLPASLKAHIVSKVRPFDSNNVVAMLPGSSAQLKEQAVMYSAHYDHLGIVPGMPGDNIYNGANDNATGVGILLEIARAYSTSKQPPPRSIYFASVTAEEQGLRGSEYFGKNPPVPAKQISARSQLRRPCSTRGARRSSSRWSRAHNVLSRSAEDGEGVWLDDRP